MGRPPCCDKDGIKKGPWTPEEDIILVSYVQEHGPGNWRSVPTNTGLMRCSKSCRLRWTNYLRPGIKRGNFTPHEEGMIIHLQALLGNKWAAIASYLPQRTDNDIKNYWNTHLKKKLKRFQSAFQVQEVSQQLLSSSSSSSHTMIDDCQHQINHHQFSSETSFEHDTVQQQPPPPPSQSTCYASSTENISRLLENWMKCSPTITKGKVSDNNDNNATFVHYVRGGDGGGCSVDPEKMRHNQKEDHFETILSFDQCHSHNNNHNVGAAATTTNTTCDSMEDQDIELEGKMIHQTDNTVVDDDDNNNDNPPLTFLEKWLLDETSSRQVVEEILNLPTIF